MKLKDQNISAQKIAEEKVRELNDANQDKIQEINLNMSQMIEAKNQELRKKEEQIKLLVIEKDRIQQKQIQERSNAENVSSTDRAQIKNLQSLVAADNQSLRLLREQLGEAKATITQLNIQNKNALDKAKKEYEDNDRKLKDQLSEKERQKSILVHQKELNHQNLQNQLQAKYKIQNIEIEKLRCEKERLSLFQTQTLQNINTIKHQCEEKIKELMDKHHSELKDKIQTVSQMQSRINELELELKLHQQAAKNLRLTVQDKDKEIIEKQLQIEKFYKQGQANGMQQKETAKLAQKLKALNDKQQQLNSYNKSLEQELKQKRGQCIELRNQLQQMKQKIFRISLKSAENRSPQAFNLIKQSPFGRIIKPQGGTMMNTLGSIGKQSSFQKHQKEYQQIMQNIGDDQFLRQSIGDGDKFRSVNKEMLQNFEKQQHQNIDNYKPNLQSYEQLQEIQRLIEENRQLKEANSQMMRQMQDISRMQQQQKQTGSYPEVAQLRIKNEKLTSLLASAQDSLLVAKDNQIQYQKTITQNQKRIDQLQNENIKLKQDRDKMATISTDLRTKICSLQNQLAHIMNQMQQQKQHVLEVQDYAKRLETQLKKREELEQCRNKAMFQKDKLIIQGERVIMAEKQEDFIYRPNSAKATRGQMLSQLQMKKKQQQAMAIKQRPVLETVKMRAEKAAWKKQNDQ